MTDPMNKEQVYDTHIQPLMAQIHAICKEHKIGYLASFALPIPQDDGLRCTSALLDPEYTTDTDGAEDYTTALRCLLSGAKATIRAVRG